MTNEIELIGHYGGDITHACAAWTSTDSILTDEKRERIPKLLADLAKNGHGTPFERSLLHFKVVCEQASHIHILKHRMMSVNGESARYKELTEDRYYLPADWPDELKLALERHNQLSFYQYHTVLKQLEASGMSRKRAKESARYFLTYSSQLELDMSFNFRTFVNFQQLRNKPNAQQEIQQIARAMLDLVRSTGEFNHSLAAFNL